MIAIKRDSCPAVLNKQAEDFGESDFSNDDVKETLLEMQHGKCCYCEIKLLVGTVIKEVDHHIPKSASDFKDKQGNVQWHLANCWTNLVYACRTCNNAKGSKHPFDEATGERRLMDPCVEGIDPEQHIDFIIGDVYVAHKEKGKTPLGTTTVRILKLGIRSDLFGGFKRAALEIEGCGSELLLAMVNNDTHKMNTKMNDLRIMASAHQEFAAFRRAFTAKVIREMNEKDIPELESRFKKTFPRVNICIPKGAEVVTT